MPHALFTKYCGWAWVGYWIVCGECRKFVEKLYIDLTTADIGVILHPFRHPPKRQTGKKMKTSAQTATQTATSNIAFNVAFFDYLEGGVVKGYAKIRSLTSDFKWEELSAVLDGLYRLHGAAAPVVADDSWHNGQHPLQIEIAKQTTSMDC